MSSILAHARQEWQFKPDFLVQAPSSPAELSTPMLSTDSALGSEPLLGDRAFSTRDLNPNSVACTTSTLSMMSEDSAAESSGSEPDPAASVSPLPGHGRDLGHPDTLQGQKLRAVSVGMQCVMRKAVQSG